MLLTKIWYGLILALEFHTDPCGRAEKITELWDNITVQGDSSEDQEYLKCDLNRVGWQNISVADRGYGDSSPVETREVLWQYLLIFHTCFIHPVYHFQVTWNVRCNCEKTPDHVQEETHQDQTHNNTFSFRWNVDVFNNLLKLLSSIENLYHFDNSKNSKNSWNFHKFDKFWSISFCCIIV